MTVRYGAKTELRSRELEATSSKIWSEAITVIYETDPEIVAAVLPKTLRPAERPLVRATLTTVTMPGGHTFGAGYFAVRARHGDFEGEYPIFMPMSTEQATIGGRETFGEPKKIGEVYARKTGDTVEGSVSRLGFPLIEVHGTVNETREPYELTKTDFYFKFLMNPDGSGFDSDPALVYCTKNEEARLHLGIDGEIILKDSPIDPVADLVVRRVVDINWTERATVQKGKIVGTVPAADVLPWAHQRYDDLSVLGKKD
jgi:acetoacetate decarboxylase